MPAAIENDRAVVPPAASQLLKTMLRCRSETDVHWMDVGASVTTAEPNEYVSVKAEPPAGGSTTAFTSMVYASFR